MDVGYDVPDPGMVPDGTKCGANMVSNEHTIWNEVLLIVNVSIEYAILRDYYTVILKKNW